MGSMDGGDDRIFKADFTGEGAAKLRETVKEKLKEFMGDYTDDTLVEYVIVLLRNGRSKDEARNELDVFLGDDSDSFISWLWDHLSTSLDLYVQCKETDKDDVSEIKHSLDDQAGRISGNLDSGIEGGKSSNLSRRRHDREWKGLVRETTDHPPLLSSEIERIHPEKKIHGTANHGKRSASPHDQSQRKRGRSDDKHQLTEAGRQVIDAPRRLLQFAVRDAVGTSRPDSTAESALKRLRSVVSTSNEELPSVDRPQRIQSIALLPNSMATVIKAVAEAAEDVRKVKPSRSVFDRLGRGEDPEEPQHLKHREAIVAGELYGGTNQFPVENRSTYFERQGQFDGEMTMMEQDSDLASVYVSDYGQYEQTDVEVQENAFGRDDENFPMMHHEVSNYDDDSMRFRRNEEQDEPPITRSIHCRMALPAKSVYTGKSPHYLAPKQAPAPQNRKPLQQNVAAANASDLQLIQEKSFPVSAPNGNVQYTDPQRTTQQSPNGLSVRSTENADSWTIHVNNVHLAATKNSLSQHFSKFGEVLEVIINTDAASGQPIGSAMIEFARKESADNALSLDGTSFMSRILKVMKPSPSALQKPTPTTAMTWPRTVRGSPYARFPRVPFPRGMHGTFRGRPPIRGGARSMQWKRDSQSTSSEASGSVSTSSPFISTHASTVRRFTYVRTEAKPEGNVGASAT
ncbi:hypothetical protein SAY87_009744 [Trapa incisa]|uniref:RRM domain-containing protein n=1 Tax=Trapa incisa TaxID=236973 RepID=A0AAN7PXL0_9MYRT|nr:hypothetical protein SAY87_009744 [Trapa incisa]